MVFLTDGHRLFELLAEDVRRNYGLGGSFIREVAIRDAATEDVEFVFGERLARLRPV